MTMLRNFLLAVALAIAGGCASSKNTGPSFHAGDEKTPEFFNGPAVALITNASAYSARLNTDIVGPSGLEHPLAGELLQSGGRLVFQPDQTSSKKHPGAGIIFLWDANQQRGWTVSETLQGYAPAPSTLQVAEVKYDAASATPDQIDSHPCHRINALITLTDGSTSRYVVWQADDLRHFPIRVQSASGGKPTTLNFSDIRFESPDADLFEPPDGFVRFENPVAMMNELIIRETTVGQRAESPTILTPQTPVNPYATMPSAQ